MNTKLATRTEAPKQKAPTSKSALSTMFYAIDFDTRSVESKSTDGEILAAYILDNDLTMAVALVGSEDELCLQFSLKEMQELSNNLGGDKEYESDEQAAEWCWRLLEQWQDDFPKFTTTLGKKLLKAAARRNKDTDSGNTDASKTEPARKLRTSSKPAGKRPTDATVLTLGNRPRDTTVLYKVWRTVEDNLGDMSIGDIVAECELDEQQCRKQISRCIRKEVLIKVEEKL